MKNLKKTFNNSIKHIFFNFSEILSLLNQQSFG